MSDLINHGIARIDNSLAGSKEHSDSLVNSGLSSCVNKSPECEEEKVEQSLGSEDSDTSTTSEPPINVVVRALGETDDILHFDVWSALLDLDAKIARGKWPATEGDQPQPN